MLISTGPTGHSQAFSRSLSSLPYAREDRQQTKDTYTQNPIPKDLALLAYLLACLLAAHTSIQSIQPITAPSHCTQSNSTSTSTSTSLYFYLGTFVLLALSTLLLLLDWSPPADIHFHSSPSLSLQPLLQSPQLPPQQPRRVAPSVSNYTSVYQHPLLRIPPDT